MLQSYHGACVKRAEPLEIELEIELGEDFQAARKEHCGNQALAVASVFRRAFRRLL